MKLFEKNITALILACMMLLSVCPMGAFATEEEIPAEPIIETPVESDKVEEIDEDDTFEYNENIPMVDLYISYNKPVDKYQKGILLRDGFMQYIYSCEERKCLDRFTDKNVNKMIATLVAPAIGMEAKDLALLLGRAEYSNTGKVK